jgi:hypothetical protein
VSKQLITATRLTTLLSCPRLHFWRYEIGLKPKQTAEALRVGSAWHSAMESRWLGAPYDCALSAALPEGVNLDELQTAVVGGLLAGYYRLYGDGTQDPNIKELQPEVEFSTKLAGSNSFDVAGKIDGLAVLRDGRLALLEHKTCGTDISPESEYWLRLRFNTQVLQYVLAARALGWAIETVLYDVTRKPAIRQKQTETIDDFGERLADDCSTRPEFYFARREVPVLAQDLEEFKVQRLVLSRQILQCRIAEKRLADRSQAWPRNVSEMVCRSCEFSSFCLQNVRVDPTNPPAGFVVGDQHEELQYGPTSS